MTNQDFIDKYKNEKFIIATYYQRRTKDGNLENIKDIVNPLKIDNRQLCSKTDDQGEFPHCAGVSCCQLAEAIYWKYTGKLINLDGDQVYAMAKLLDGSQNEEGTYIDYAIEAAIKLAAFPNLENIKIGILKSSYEYLKLENTLKFLIHKYDFLLGGFNIDTSWYDCNQEHYIIAGGGDPAGGHAVLIPGYSPDGVFIQNQWGDAWGSKGFGILPWDLFDEEFGYACYVTM